MSTVFCISQHLLGIKGAKIENIKTVYSHPQGIQQSADFLRNNPQMLSQDFSNTAAAAKYVSECNDYLKERLLQKWLQNCMI